MHTAILLTALFAPSFQGDPPKTTVPEAAIQQEGEHPVVAAVRESLTAGKGRVDRPFTLVVSIQTSDPAKVIKAFEAPLAETPKESGNIMYLLNQDADEPEKFLLVERWKNLDALASHLAQPYLVQLLQDLDATASIELQVLRPVGAKKRKAKAE